ncbi:MAG: helix-hairpin-helix domain-containing protein [Gammaproteobacteria bacterium]|nr:helix-hairpin-helix domain-containing protein [Gammaproteobacteria bacterium]
MRTARYSFLMMLTVLLSFSSIFVVSMVVAEVQEAEIELAEQKTISVNINSAKAEELSEKLVGVGAARAELIVQYRDMNGPFTSIEQLLEIRGIGAATLEKNRDKIRL